MNAKEPFFCDWYVFLTIHMCVFVNDMSHEIGA